MGTEKHGSEGSEPTIWSTIVKARDGAGEVQSDALGRLLKRYQPQIYQQIHFRLPTNLRTREYVDDLTQEFILHCLRVEFLKNLDPKKGRFRCFLRESIKNFLVQEHRRRTAKKRDVGLEAFSINETTLGGGQRLDPSDRTVSPDEHLDRQWALGLLARAMETLAAECKKAKRLTLFEALKGNLSMTEEGMPGAEMAQKLGIPESSVRVALFRLRSRLGELVRDEVQQTIGEEEDWREELRYLVELLGRR